MTGGNPGRSLCMLNHQGELGKSLRKSCISRGMSADSDTLQKLPAILNHKSSVQKFQIPKDSHSEKLNLL